MDSKSGSASLSSRRNSPKLDDGILVLSGCSLDPDLCIKLHDGGDDKSQYLIDWREFEKQRKTNGLLGEHGVDQTKNNHHDYYDSLLVACCICKQHFCDPVVTTCKHYFCSACALEVTPLSLCVILNFFFSFLRSLNYFFRLIIRV